VNTHDPIKISEVMLNELNYLGGCTIQIWHRMLDVVRQVPRHVMVYLSDIHTDRSKDYVNHCCIKEVFRSKDFVTHMEEQEGEIHKVQALNKRNSAAFNDIRPPTIEDLRFYSRPNEHPILFEDLYLRDVNMASMALEESRDLDFSEANGVHLFVLVHGFQGNSFDMRLLKNNFSLIIPDALFLCSNSNEESTEGDIGEMGVRLAQEVVNYITEWCPGNTLGRINFIGHSMGGVIIRAALPYLEEYSHKMHLYMSLSTPHLGYMYKYSKLIDAGMWFLKKWRGSQCLQQLSMTDTKDVKSSFIYQLTNKKGLNWFKHVVLVASYQD